MTDQPITEADLKELEIKVRKVSNLRYAKDPVSDSLSFSVHAQIAIPKLIKRIRELEDEIRRLRDGRKC